MSLQWEAGRGGGGGWELGLALWPLGGQAKAKIESSESSFPFTAKSPSWTHLTRPQGGPT